jgi:hypothetical protein
MNLQASNAEYASWRHCCVKELTGNGFLGLAIGAGRKKAGWK